MRLNRGRDHNRIDVSFEQLSVIEEVLDLRVMFPGASQPVGLRVGYADKIHLRNGAKVPNQLGAPVAVSEHSDPNSLRLVAQGNSKSHPPPLSRYASVNGLTALSLGCSICNATISPSHRYMSEMEASLGRFSGDLTQDVH